MELKKEILKPGEYRGACGAIHEAKAITYNCQESRSPWGGMIFPAHGDFPAALAALQALYEQQKPEWVEIDKWSRIRADGTDPQWRSAAHPWAAASENCLWIPAYRAGLERGKS